MRMLMLTTKRDISSRLIREAAERRGVALSRLYYEDICTGYEIDAEQYGFCIPRDPYNTGEDYSAVMMDVISRFSSDKVLDFRVFQENPRYEDKLFQHNLFSGIMDMPRAWHFSSPEEVALKNFPVVVKKRISSRGRGVYVIKDMNEMKRFMSEHEISEFIIEEKIDIKRDIRALLLGHKIIGSVERIVRSKNNHGYAGIGVRVAGGYEVPDNIGKRITQASIRIGSDFCGIDFVEDANGDMWLLECNISPQFAALQNTLKLDVAGMLIDFILSKF